MCKMSANIEVGFGWWSLRVFIVPFQNWRRTYLPWRIILDHVILWLSLFICSVSLFRLSFNLNHMILQLLQDILPLCILFQYM